MSQSKPPRPPASRPPASRSAGSARPAARQSPHASPQPAPQRSAYSPARPAFHQPTHHPAHQQARPAARQPAPATPPAPLQPLSEAELDQLQDLLDAVPAPLETLDVTMLDGFLVGVLLQPKAVPTFQWTRYVLDTEGRSPPEGFDSRQLIGLVKRRYQELNQAITQRLWFDPWVFELEEDADPSEVVFPWVAGFSLATELFPDLTREEAADLLEPLASLYMHMDPDDLEDADELLQVIETLEPPADLSEAVESLVRSTLELADISRPQPKPVAAQKPPARRGPARPRDRY
jgi:uncharacterized protein